MTGLDGVKPDSVCQQVNIGADYTEEEVEFLKVMDRYIRRVGRKFPTFVEVLRVAKAVGYAKTTPPLPPGGSNGEHQRDA
jgi:hypothetical protein